MAKNLKVAELEEFDPAPYLDDEKAIAAYLTDILSANDGALLAAALGDIARARGMTEIAKASGLTREALYKALRPEMFGNTKSRACRTGKEGALSIMCCGAMTAYRSPWSKPNAPRKVLWKANVRLNFMLTAWIQ